MKMSRAPRRGSLQGSPPNHHRSSSDQLRFLRDDTDYLHRATPAAIPQHQSTRYPTTERAINLTHDHDDDNWAARGPVALPGMVPPPAPPPLLGAASGVGPQQQPCDCDECLVTSSPESSSSSSGDSSQRTLASPKQSLRDHARQKSKNRSSRGNQATSRSRDRSVDGFNSDYRHPPRTTSYNSSPSMPSRSQSTNKLNMADLAGSPFLSGYPQKPIAASAAVAMLPVLPQNPLSVSLKWKNVSYRIDKRSRYAKSKSAVLGGSHKASTFSGTDDSSPVKVILKNVSGQVRSGQLMAVMGPSGAGKSTLLECLAGRRSAGISGSISVTKIHGLRISFISQADHNHRQLTVRETLIYASKIKNCGRVVKVGGGGGSLLTGYDNPAMAGNTGSLSSSASSSETLDHHLDRDLHHLDQPLNRIQTIAYSAFNQQQQLIRPTTQTVIALPVDGKMATKKKNLSIHEAVALKVARQLGLESCLDVKLCKCSGGQQKRVSIAVELVSTPHILILDEPTSGLDSSSCFQCISLLTEMAHSASEPLTVLLTVHQPSARLLNLFDNLYVLSKSGMCIYNGPTSNLLDTLKQRGLTCPVYYNPADYLIEIASGDYGKDAIAKLVCESTMSVMTVPNKNRSAHEGLVEPYQRPILKMVHRKRSFPTWSHLWILLCRTLLSSFREPFLTSVRLVMHVAVAIVVALLYGPNVGKEDGCMGSFAMINFTTPKDFHDQQIEKESRINANVALLFFCNLFIVFASMMPMALTFPMEMAVFIKEKTNHWYSCAAFFVAKLLADTPFVIIFPAMFIAIVYYMTGQDPENWRFGSMVLVVVLVASICQSIGLMTGAIFVSSMDSAVFFAPLSVLPALLFSGFFVKISAMPSYFAPLASISYFRYGFEAVMVIIYGGRCDQYSLESIGFERIKQLIQMQSLSQQGLGGAGYSGPPAASPSSGSSFSRGPRLRTSAGTTRRPFTTTSTTSLPSSTLLPDYDQPYYDDNDIESGGGQASNQNVDYSQLAQTITAFDRTESKALSIFGINPDILYHHIVVLCIFSLVLRVLAYLVFLHKANKRN